ncbi:MAG: IspD/TarI family cytidylyltransferase [Phycisphaeraceae bacterium]
MKTAVIVPAAGLGRRFQQAGGSEAPSKVEMELAGTAVFLRVINLFAGRSDVAQVLLAVHPERVEMFRLRWGDRLRFQGVDIVPGGTRERWETVGKALEYVRGGCTHVAVHDAARPLASSEMIDRVFAAALEHGTAVPGVAVPDTLKRVLEAEEAAEAEPEGELLDAILGGAGKPAPAEVRRVVETVPRSDLVAVQTPQVFELGLLQRAYVEIEDGRLDPDGVTDDASLVEALGEPVVVVEGDPLNFKITRPQDAELAEALLARREARDAAERGRRELFGDEDEQ